MKRNNNPASAHLDIYADVTNRIIAELERGPDAWLKDWATNVDIWRPLNHATQRPYRGINVLLLAVECQQGRYALNEWLTFQQALALGSCVRKGSKSKRVVFWKQLKAKTESDEQGADDNPRGPMIAKQFHVFNVSDIDGLEASVHRPPVDDSLAARIIARSGASFVLGEPSYSIAQDVIRLPVLEAFDNPEAYYAAAFHELAHWTGARVGRECNVKRWGDDAYALEELTAELTAAMLCGVCGLPTVMQHASYLEHWIGVLRSDKRAIFSVASAAQKAADFLLWAASRDDADGMTHAA